MLDRSIEFSEQRLISRVVRLLDVPEPAAKRLLAEHGLATGKGAGAEMDGVLREIVGAELAVLKAEIGKTLHYAASKTRGNGIDNVLWWGRSRAFPALRNC